MKIPSDEVVLYKVTLIVSVPIVRSSVGRSVRPSIVNMSENGVCTSLAIYGSISMLLGIWIQWWHLYTLTKLRRSPTFKVAGTTKITFYVQKVFRHL